jgi:hypothetical protein
MKDHNDFDVIDRLLCLFWPGLAALLLAHHDHLRAQAAPRTPTRTDHLHTLLRLACRPLPVADPARQGAGLVDAPTALGVPLPLTWQPEPATEQMRVATSPYPRT